MKCMKTGLRFNAPEFNDDTYHGDLFYNKTTGVAVIAGVAKATSTLPPDMKMVSDGDAFTISFTFKILGEMLVKYFPDVDLETLKVIIADTRFY